MVFFPPGQMLILPSNLAVARERERMLRQSSDGVVIQPRIYHFGRLEMEMAEDLNGVGQNKVMSDLGRDLVYGRIFESHSLAPGWEGRRLPAGIRQQLIDLIDQFKSSGIAPDQLPGLLIPRVQPEIVNSLVRIYRAYEGLLAQKDLTDRSGFRQKILQAVQTGWRPRCLADIHTILIRDFARFTPFQVDLIQALAGLVSRVRVHFNCPDWILSPPDDGPDDNTPWKETMDLVRRLESMGEGARGLELVFEPPGADDDNRPAALNHLTLNLFRWIPPGGNIPDPAGVIEIRDTPGRYAEVEEIGREIWRLLDRGIEANEIAVAVMDLGLYAPLFEDVFRRFRLPMFFRRGAPLMLQAPVRALMSLLGLPASFWEKHQVLEILASPYFDTGFRLSLSRGLGLCARTGVTDERAGGGWAENLGRLSGSHPEDREEAEALLRGLDRLRVLTYCLHQPQTWAEFARNVTGVFHDLRFEDRIRSSPSMTILHRDLTAWTRLKDCLDGLRQAAEEAGEPTRVIPPDELIRGLRGAISGENIEHLPAGGAEGISILSNYDLHGLRFNYLFLAGLNEGEFPRSIREGAVISEDAALAVNRSLRRPALKTATQDYRRQELLFQQAVSSVRRCLYLSFNSTDDNGRLRLPSLVLDEVRRIWPAESLPIQRVNPPRVPGFDAALAREELIEALSFHLLRDGRAGEMEPALSISAALEQRAGESDRWRTTRARSLFEQGQVLPETDGNGYGPPAEMDRSLLNRWLSTLDYHRGFPILAPTFLQEYANCPFSFWVSRVIGLPPMDEVEDEASPRDEGSIMHKIAFRFMHSCRERGAFPLRGAPEEERLLSQTMAELLDAAEKRMPLGRKPLWEIRRRSMETILRHWLDLERRRAESWTPTFFEWIFGPTGLPGDGKKNAPPVAMDLLGGGRLFFKGRVDRIDRSDSGYLVIDYKNTGNSAVYHKLLKPENLGVSNFQLPLYQTAVAGTLKNPTRATWVLWKTPPDLKQNYTPATDQLFFDSDPVRRQRMREGGEPNFFNRLEDIWVRLARGLFPPNPQQAACEYCDYKRICRAASSTADNDHDPAGGP